MMSSRFKEIIKNWKVSLLYLFIVELIVAFSYRDIFSGFFQQDEWLAFGYNFSLQNKTAFELLAQFFSPNVGHYQPMNNVVIFVLISFFSTNYIAFALISLSLHLANVLLVFILAQSIFNNNKLSALTALLFGISASSYQATSWVMADVGIHLSTLLAITSIIFLLRFLKYYKKKFATICLVLLFIALLFKESVIGLFLFLPSIYYVLKEEKQLPRINFSLSKFLHKKNRFSIVIFGFAAVYIFIRLIFILIPSSYTNDALVTQSQSIKHLTYNLATMPIKGLTQSMIPHTVLIDTARVLTSFLPLTVVGLPNTTQFDLFVEKRMLEVVNLVFFLLFLALFWLIFKAGTKLEVKAVIVGGLLVGFNSFIFAFTPEKSGILSLIDSRNLYLLSIGSAFCIVAVLSFLGSLIQKKLSLKMDYVLLVLSLPVLFWNYWLISERLTHLNEEASIRESILRRIATDYPKLPDKVIFFTESNQAYYGLPPEEKILPFQSGFGQTLLVWYYANEKFPLEFFHNKFLWNITDQGYKEIDGRGVGYFRDMHLLKKQLKEKRLPIESVIAYSWKSEAGILEDVSDKVRKDLKKDLE